MKEKMKDDDGAEGAKARAGAGSGRAPLFFADPGALQEWFERCRTAEKELIVGFFKKGTGKASVTWAEAVDEALCVGWIDGVRRRLDTESYTVRFTPRRPGSIWSAVNVRRVAALTAEGRMRAEGVAAFQKRREARSGIYAYEQAEATELPEWGVARFQEHPAAWEWFQRQAAWYRRTAAWRVVSAKQEATRVRRLELLIAAAVRGERWLNQERGES